MNYYFTQSIFGEYNEAQFMRVLLFTTTTKLYQYDLSFVNYGVELDFDWHNFWVMVYDWSICYPLLARTHNAIMQFRHALPLSKLRFVPEEDLFVSLRRKSMIGLRTLFATLSILNETFLFIQKISAFGCHSHQNERYALLLHRETTCMCHKYISYSLVQNSSSWYNFGFVNTFRVSIVELQCSYGLKVGVRSRRLVFEDIRIMGSGQGKMLGVRVKMQ